MRFALGGSHFGLLLIERARFTSGLQFSLPCLPRRSLAEGGLAVAAVTTGAWVQGTCRRACGYRAFDLYFGVAHFILAGRANTLRARRRSGETPISSALRSTGRDTALCVNPIRVRFLFSHQNRRHCRSRQNAGRFFCAEPLTQAAWRWRACSRSTALLAESDKAGKR